MHWTSLRLDHGLTKTSAFPPYKGSSHNFPDLPNFIYSSQSCPVFALCGHIVLVIEASRSDALSQSVLGGTRAIPQVMDRRSATDHHLDQLSLILNPSCLIFLGKPF